MKYKHEIQTIANQLSSAAQKALEKEGREVVITPEMKSAIYRYAAKYHSALMRITFGWSPFGGEYSALRLLLDTAECGSQDALEVLATAAQLEYMTREHKEKFESAEFSWDMTRLMEVE